jgi:hypothetical protein
MGLDIRVSGDAGAASVEIDAHDAPLRLTPRAARELAREIEECARVAEGNAVNRRAPDGDAISWSESVSFLLSAFVPPGSIA